MVFISLVVEKKTEKPQTKFTTKTKITFLTHLFQTTDFWKLKNEPFQIFSQYPSICFKLFHLESRKVWAWIKELAFQVFFKTLKTTYFDKTYCIRLFRFICVA